VLSFISALAAGSDSRVKGEMLCRYHPHLHGSTALQSQTASGPITVESDVAFLTASKGCTPLNKLHQSIQTRILYLQTLFFGDADVEADPS